MIDAILNHGPLPRYVPWHTLGQTVEIDGFHTTVVHLAMKNRRIDLLLPDHLTSEHLQLRDGNLQTPVHLAAISGCIDKIPKSLLTRADLHALDDRRRTPLQCAYKSGNLSKVPKNLLTAEMINEEVEKNVTNLNEPSSQNLATELKELAEAEDFNHPKFSDFDFLSKNPPFSENSATWFHWLGSLGLLSSLPDRAFTKDVLSLRDPAGKTPLHVSAEQYGVQYLPTQWITRENLLLPDDSGCTAFHSLALLEDLGGADPKLISEEVLRATDLKDVSVADLLDEYDQTRLLPPHLHGFARRPALKRLRELLHQTFVEAEHVWKSDLARALSRETFEDERLQFVKKWSGSRFKFALDDEQARAVIESGEHLLLSARAGSGKTGTLVARALFEIEVRRTDPRKIVILAFNKKAAKEVRNRLVKKTGKDRCPHVMTFHSLAYRLVHPEKGTILMDDKDSDEGKALSQVLNGLIDDEIRNGTLADQIREIMLLRWEAEWNSIVDAGGLLKQEDALVAREARNFHSIDGKHFDSPMEKVIADELVKRGRNYGYRKKVYERSGLRYVPTFLTFDADRKVIIDIAGTADSECQRAKEIYWKGEQSSGAFRIELSDIEQCGGIEEFRSELIAQFEHEDLGWQTLSADQLWEKVKKRAIGEFTRSVVQFVGRCQVELWNPESLAERIKAHADKACLLPLEDTEDKTCILFWKICQRFFQAYLDRLKELQKTDFDHLMMDATSTIRQGKTQFRSEWSDGNLAEVQHVFVDEYQDFSHLFNALREAIQEQNTNAKFFCVGDDWQAINGFAGSNLRYFQNFSQIFSGSQKLEILRNYRSAPEIVELGNRVMTGKGSASIPAQEIKGRICQIFTDSNSKSNGEWEECVEEQLGLKAMPLLKLISRSIQEDRELLVLFRNRTIWTPIGGLSLSEFRRKLISWLDTDLEQKVVFSTTHSYKGGEADHVVMVDPEDYPLLHSERMFSRIFGDNDESITEDERRLFYVGITRAKEQLVLLRDQRTKFLNGLEVPMIIPFLRDEQIQTAVLDAVASPVCPGDRCMVRVTCGPNRLGSRFKKAGFTYFEGRKSWRRLIESSVPRNRFECGEFLKGLPWLKELMRFSVEFVWKDRSEVFEYVDGTEGQNRTSSKSEANASHGVSSQGIQHPPVPHYEADPDLVTKVVPEASDMAVNSGIFNTSVVGTKHHHLERAMLLNTGEFVQLIREPSNPHDPNAIKVLASCGTQIGYLSRHVAAHLARGLDDWGGTIQAKITSVWKQPAPQAHVSASICFPLPPGVSIPPELDRLASLEDSPFSKPKRDLIETPESYSQQPIIEEHPPELYDTSEPSNGNAHRKKLSDTQNEELDLIMNDRLRDLIRNLALEQAIPWPVVGYEGGTSDTADGTMLEVAWRDYKVGIAVPGDQVEPFKRRNWTVFSAEIVTKDDIITALENATS